MPEYNGGEVVSTVGDLLTGLLSVAIKNMIEEHMKQNNGRINVEGLSMELAEEIIKTKKEKEKGFL